MGGEVSVDEGKLRRERAVHDGALLSLSGIFSLGEERVGGSLAEVLKLGYLSLVQQEPQQEVGEEQECGRNSSISRILQDSIEGLAEDSRSRVSSIQVSDNSEASEQVWCDREGNSDNMSEQGTPQTVAAVTTETVNTVVCNTSQQPQEDAVSRASGTTGSVASGTASTTTISTIAVQSGNTKVVLALLQVGGSCVLHGVSVT